MDVFTVTAWLKANSFSDYGRIVSDLFGVKGFEVFLSDNGVIDLRVGNGQAKSDVNGGEVTILTTREWYFIAITYDGTAGSGGNVVFYRAQSGAPAFATQERTFQQGPIAANGVSFMIGNSTDTAGRPFDGLIDNVRIYRGLLTQGDLMNVMKAKDISN